MPTPTDIINQMMAKDTFSQWMGIERIKEGAGFCTLVMTVNDNMCNGFGIAHGGISYSFADSALAFAANSHGVHALSISTTIAHLLPIYSGEKIYAIATEKQLGNKTGLYEVRIEKEDGQLAALFTGTVYRKKENW